MSIVTKGKGLLVLAAVLIASSLVFAPMGYYNTARGVVNKVYAQEEDEGVEEVTTDDEEEEPTTAEEVVIDEQQPTTTTEDVVPEGGGGEEQPIPGQSLTTTEEGQQPPPTNVTALLLTNQTNQTGLASNDTMQLTTPLPSDNATLSLMEELPETAEPMVLGVCYYKGDQYTVGSVIKMEDGRFYECDRFRDLGDVWRRIDPQPSPP